MKSTAADKTVEQGGSPGGPPEVKVDAVPGQKLQQMMTDERVVVFGNTWCPFCTEVKRTLDERITAQGSKYTYYRLDQMDDGAEVHAQLKETTGQTSVPYLFVDGVLLGGCDKLMDGAFDGSMTHVLGALPASGTAAHVSAPDRVPAALFLFPNSVDNRAVRLTSCLASASALTLAILGCLDETHDVARWLALALFIGFALRVFAGTGASPLGSLAIALIGIFQRFTNSRAKFGNGIPKQFANCVGVMFAGLGALFLLLANSHGKGFRWAGAAFLGGLAGAAFLQGALDFCLACWMFGLGIRFGLLPKTLYTRFISERGDTTAGWSVEHTRLFEGPAATGSSKYVQLKGEATKMDPRWKEKTDAMRRDDQHFVRHFKASYWGMPLSLAALGFVFLRAHTQHGAPHLPSLVWKILSLLSAAVWLVFALLQLARCFMYRSKVAKEWACPVRSNGFLFATITPLVWIHFAIDLGEPELAKALFWAVAPLQLFLSFLLMSHWMYKLHDFEHLSVLWLAVPLANVFSAVAWVAIWPGRGQLTSAAQLFMGAAVLLFAALYPLTLYKVLLGHNMDADNRPVHWLLAAAPAVLAVGWQAVLSPVAISPVFLSLYFGSVFLTACLCYGIWPARFYLTGPWTMGNWTPAFTLSAVALATITFHNTALTHLSEIMVIAALAAASLANVLCAGHFVRDVFVYKVFTGAQPMGPLSFTKLTHEAFRGMFPRLKNVMARCAAGDDGAVAAFLAMWSDYVFLHRVHMMHEEKVIFGAADEWHPHHSDPFQQEHQEDEERMAKVAPLLDVARAAPRHAQGAAFDRGLVGMVHTVLDRFAAHLVHEENELSPVLRKHMPVAQMKSTIRRVWKATDSLDMFRFLPLVVNNIERHGQRVAFVRTLIWSMPERCEQIGMMIALGVDPVMWQRLTDDLPDIIPRGMPGWARHS